MNYTKLSKQMSYVLRHHPEALGLQLDPEGFVDVEELAEAMNSTGKFERPITVKDFERVIAQGDKQRYEIRDGMIRAMYGHTVESVVVQTEAEPPDMLYHGTPRRNVEKILKEGLKPMQRQYVHCSPTVEWAKRVGGRRDSKPAVLLVHAKESYAAGVPFYTCNDQVWLSGPIPPEYLEVLAQTPESSVGKRAQDHGY